MKQMINIIVFLLLISSLYKCEKTVEEKYAVYLKNNASYSIGCYFGLGGDFGTLFPDTTLPATNQYLITEIKSGGRYIYDSGIEWDEIYSKLPQDTMSVFIFHTDTLTKYTWREVREGYRVLKRYDLSLQDLEQMNWTITYP